MLNVERALCRYLKNYDILKICLYKGLKGRCTRGRRVDAKSYAYNTVSDVGWFVVADPAVASYANIIINYFKLNS